MHMRAWAVVSLLGALVPGCGGTFCEAYPDACGTADGVEVQVSLLDANGELVAGASVLLSDSDGKVVDLLFTGPEAPLTVTLPAEGYVSVFSDDRYAFTAFATKDTPVLAFQIAGASENASNDVQVAASCGVNDCLEDSQVALSCRAPFSLIAVGNDASGVVEDYAGCASRPDYDAFFVVYDADGIAVRASSALGVELGPGPLELPFAPSLDDGERLDFEMVLDGAIDFESIKRTVRVPYLDGGGYGYSVTSSDSPDSIHFSLVKDFVPHADAVFALSLADERSLVRQQRLDPVPASASMSTDFAIPNRAPPLQQDDPQRPEAFYELGEGRLGEAMQLTVKQGNLRWVVSLPADAKGHFALPELPEELSSYLLADEDDYDVLNIDLDDAEDYAAFAGRPIRDYAADSGPESVTIGRSSR